MPERPAMPGYLRVTALLALLALLAGFTAWYLWARYQDFLDTPLNLPLGGHVFVLSPGSSGSDIVRQLVAEGITRPGWEWKLLMRLERHVYRSGEYQLESGMRPQQVLETLSNTG